MTEGKLGSRSVGKVIESNYPDAYLAPLFKNVKKCSDIRKKYEGV